MFPGKKNWISQAVIMELYIELWISMDGIWIEMGWIMQISKSIQNQFKSKYYFIKRTHCAMYILFKNSV